MSHLGLRLDGLAELREALRQLAPDLADKASDIVVAHAEAAANEIQRDYPQRSGRLKARLTTTKQRTSVQARAVVASRAPHANIFESGTTDRHTKRGWNRGRMPKAPIAEAMIPKAIRWRARMVGALTVFLREQGFEVSG